MGSACPSRRGPWTQGPPVVGRGTGWPARVVAGLNQQRVVMYHVELLVAPHSPSHTQTLWHRLRLWRPDAANFRYFSPPLRRRRSSRDLCLRLQIFLGQVRSFVPPVQTTRSARRRSGARTS